MESFSEPSYQTQAFPNCDHDGRIQNIGVNIALVNSKTLNERI